MADSNAKYLLFNPAAVHIIGMGPTDGPPEKWPEIYGIFHPDTMAPLKKDELALLRAVRGEATDQAEVFIRNPQKPDGVYLSVTGRPLKDERGNVRGGTIILHDITKQKQAGVEIRQLNEDLCLIGGFAAHGPQ